MNAPVHLCRPARSLAALHRRSTFYEAGLFDQAGRLRAVLAYDAKRSRRALLLAVYDHGPAIAEMAGVNASDCAVDWTGEQFAIGESGWRIGWTGATERDRASARQLEGVAL